MDLNSCNFSGRLGKDPEMRFLSDGRAVTHFPLGVSLAREKTLWLDVTVWGKQAENCNQYLNKGDEVMISGYLTEDVWEDKSGQRRRTKKMIASFVRFGRKKGDGSGGGGSSSKEEEPPEEEAAPAQTTDSADEYPF